MKRSVTIVFILMHLVCSCDRGSIKKSAGNVVYDYYPDGKIKSETEVKDTIANGVMKNYDRDGNPMSACTFRMGVLEGPAVTYYPNGQVEHKMNYSAGKKEGMAQWFYSTGELYRTVNYKGGMTDGLRTTFFKKGGVMAEAPFRENMPGLGLKEYNEKSELIEDNTEILITEDNRLFAENRFILNIRLSKPHPDAAFYLGELAGGKYITPGQYQLPEKDGTAIYEIFLGKGGFRMETLTITASWRTETSNTRVITRNYNLAIDNK
jgi:hypothetical protein